MELSEAVSLARVWVSGNSSGFELSSVKEDERRIYLVSQKGSFYVTVPQSSQEEWVVWSDEEKWVNPLKCSLDQLSKPSNSLEQVLERATSILKSVDTEGGVASEDEGEELEEGDNEEEFDDYYDDDHDVDEQVEKQSDEEESAAKFFTGQGSPAAVHRLISDLKALNKSSSKFGIAGQPVKDNLFEWTVELSDFPAESLLAKDLERYAANTKRDPVVTMEMKFPKDYPMNPPFVRILRPRFKFLTGHVTIGGSICMQMLTRSGWSPSNDIESILVQIRAEIMSDPNARLEATGRDTDYSEQEARSAFERMVMKYGWKK